MTNSHNFKIDKAKLYFRKPIYITDQIVLTQPTIDDIVEFGEDEFYSTLYLIIGNTTMFRAKLWDIGKDWNKISDFELFCSLVTLLEPEATQFIFGDLDFTKFEPDLRITLEGELVPGLQHQEQNIFIDESLYKYIVTYVRTMFGIFPKNEFGKGKMAKEMMIEEDKERIKKNHESSDSFLLPLISGCVNHPGFKYSTQELKNVGIFEFMDSVQRLQIYESTVALLHGRCGGFMDASKIDPKEFNFMRSTNA